MSGIGSRFKADVPKQYFLFKDKETERVLFYHTTLKLLKNIPFTSVIFVVRQDHLKSDFFLASYQKIKKEYPNVSFYSTSGGKTRHQSLEKGFYFLKEKIKPDDLVLSVHDANRPYLTDTFLKNSWQEMKKISIEKPCSVPILHNTDSLLEKDSDQIQYLKREKIFRIQTPQLIWGAAIEKAFIQKKRSYPQGKEWQDEGSFMQQMGFPLSTYQGDATNQKITYREDIQEIL